VPARLVGIASSPALGGFVSQNQVAIGIHQTARVHLLRIGTHVVG